MSSSASQKPAEPLVADLSGGDKIAYFDSGPVPDSDDFTTLILIHGLHFNSYGFEHLLPLAHKFNLRLIAPQRKDYSGSSKYTPAELTALTKNPRGFFQGATRTLAQLVLHLIESTKVCKPNEGSSKGGVGVAGWSLGSAYAMAMFGRRDVIDEPTYSAILPYVTSLTLYDPPYDVFGMNLFPGESPPSEDISFDLMKEPFRLSVASYYNQPAQWDGRFSTLDLRGVTERCTFTSWTRAQKERWTEDFPMRSELPILVNQNTRAFLQDLTTEVFFDFNDEKTAFPHARVTYMHGKRTMWMSTIPRFTIPSRQATQTKDGRGAGVRPMTYKDVKWGHHFIHSDYPKEFLAIMGDCVGQGQRPADVKLEGIADVPVGKTA